MTSTLADRLDSWKEIASFLRRDVRTVQRWEKKEGLPVYRHQHEKLGSIYAYKSELNRWSDTRRQAGEDTPEPLEAERNRKPEKIKLAILPFGNLEEDPDDDYFSDGL